MKTSCNIAPFSSEASGSMELSCSGYSLASSCGPLTGTLVEEGSELKVGQNGYNVDVCLEMGCEGEDVSSTAVEFLPDVKHSTREPFSEFDFLTSSQDSVELQPQNDDLLCLNETNSVPNVRLICKHCGTGCLGMLELEDHVKHHKQSNGYRCQICKMQFTKSFQLLMHMKQHLRGWYVCSACGCLFRTHASLAEHAAEHPVAGESAGDIVKEKLKGAEEFEVHSWIPEDDVKSDHASISIAEGPVCQSCDSESMLAVDFSSSPLIIANSEDVLAVADCHQSVVEGVPLVAPGSHSCLMCNQVFTSHETLFDHCMSHPLIHIAGFGLPSCGICGMAFQNVVELHQHVQEKAGVLPVIRPTPIATSSTSSLNLSGSIILAALKNAIVIEPQCHDGYTDIFQSATGMVIAGGAIETDPKVECPPRETNISYVKAAPKETIRKGKTRKSDDASYVCSQCFRPFMNVQGLLCHMKMHAEGKPYKCNDCGDSFRFPKRLSIHARVFHEVILCIKCGLGEEQCSCAARKVDDAATTNSKDSKKPFSCLRCNRVFARVKALHKHELTHIQGIVHVCDICGKRFHDRSQFSRHLALHNGAQHQCQTCQKVFSSDVILRDHMKTHSNERPLTCNICGKDFKWRNALRVHLKKHYGSTYQCYMCGRDFTTKSYLMTHVEMHTGPRVRSHKCNLCDKAYYDKSALRKHRATHAVVRSRPYACSLCGKTFLANNNLQTHIKLHQNERPHKCDVCGKSFNMKGHLKRHMTIHSKTMSILQNDQVLFETEGICQETCEEVVIDSIVTIV